MYLHSLLIRNFRGIRKARLSFDETTVIIGENDSGKSSLLDALGKVLLPGAGGARCSKHTTSTASHHWHQRPRRVLYRWN
jgi:putative ATP-dependent endonuclease of OLD family